SIRGNARSSANFVAPVTFATASTLRSAFPMTLYSGIHSLGGQLHRLVDLEVSGTATEVARERFFDLAARRVRVGREQRFRSEQKRGRAIPALCRTQVRERLLERVQ